jgi:hypothetical protein
MIFAGERRLAIVVPFSAKNRDRLRTARLAVNRQGWTTINLKRNPRDLG